jgi:HK97 family phage major capsid protein
MTEWLADESRMTWNKLILAVIAEKQATELTGLDDIKKALNVTLGSKFKSTSAIITNDDGLQYLDTLKDENGRYLLNPDPTDTAKMRLRVGATTVPIKVYSNETIETKNSKIPFIIGDLKEAVKGFDRKQLSLLPSKVAVVGSGEDQLNAYEEDLTLIRGIEREDVEMRDAEAFVNGYIVTEEGSV